MFGTKTGAGNKQSKDVEEFINHKKEIPYRKFSAAWIEKGYTPIYEFISLKKKVKAEVNVFSHSVR